MIDATPKIECPRLNKHKPLRHIPPLTGAEINRFNRFVMPQDNGCWAWMGAVKKGRGLFYLRGDMLIAPRVAWRIANGHDPDRHVCHACDNPNCVNPDHLWLGTHQDNMADAVSKGRLRKPPSIEKCQRGHVMDEDNIYFRPDNGKRQCASCRHERNKRRRKTGRIMHYKDGRICGPLEAMK